MPSPRTRQVNFMRTCSPFWAFVFLTVLSACRPPLRPISAGQPEGLSARVADALVATGTYRDAEAVLLAERARGEEGRGRLLLDALLLRQDPVWQAEFLHQLGDVARPERAPYIEQQLGLEPYPPLLYSSAAPQRLRRVAQALAGRGLVPGLLDRAERHREAGEYIEAAGVLTLAQLMLPSEPSGAALRPVVSQAWQRLGHQRRCVAKLFDAAQPSSHLLREKLPEGLPPADSVAALLQSEPEALTCAVVAAQLATTEPALGSGADWAARALLLPVITSPRYASLSLTSVEREAPMPTLRGDGKRLREALERGMARFLKDRPKDVKRLLPLLGREPPAALRRERREDLALRILLDAPPVPEAGDRLRWAFRRHISVASAQPRRYVAYLEKLGPGFLDGVVLALREPDGQVRAQVISILSTYPPDVVAEAMDSEPGEVGQWSAQEKHNRELVRALFRLPLQGDATQRQITWQEALDLHRCCRGDRGTCDRLALPELKACPVWTPLAWW